MRAELIREPGSPRVLYVIPGQPRANNMVFARAAADGLRRLGVEVQGFYFSSRTHPGRVGREFLRLRECIRRLDPTIVHAQYGSVTGLLAMLAGRGRTKVLTIRGSDLNLAPSLGWLRGRASRAMTLLAARLADEVICVSTSLKAQLGRAETHAHVIASGVDTEVFFPVDQEAARASAGLPLRTPIVLFNAAQAPVLKGLPLVERALESVRARRGEVLLRVTRGELSRQELAALMNSADCLVLASEAEGSPNVVKEAMACNLPVVSVRVGDVAERLAAVTPSCLVDRTPDALAAGIDHLLALRRRSDGFQQIQAQHLTQADTVENLRRLYVTTSRSRLTPRAPLPSV